MKKLFILLLVVTSCRMGGIAQNVYGDVNGDGVVTAADVTEVYNVILGNMPTFTYTKYKVNGVAFNMVEVSEGSFLMGATYEQIDGASANEFPVHQVTLSGFSIGQTEVTQELWVAVMGSNPSWFNGTGNPDYDSNHSYFDAGINLRRPVESVSWDDCQEFIAKLNEMTGENFRLPTEAEWEFAARGGNKSRNFIYAGSNDVNNVAWYYYNIPSLPDTEGWGPQTVATKAPNELGIYDMSGNVWEYCQDFYGDYTADSQVDPTGPASGDFRINRGSSWYDNHVEYCRVAQRRMVPPNEHYAAYGFRLAR